MKFESQHFENIDNDDKFQEEKMKEKNVDNKTIDYNSIGSTRKLDINEIRVITPSIVTIGGKVIYTAIR